MEEKGQVFRSHGQKNKLLLNDAFLTCILNSPISSFLCGIVDPNYIYLKSPCESISIFGHFI